MENQLLLIFTSVFKSFKEIWPYLLLTIPLAVWVQLSGVSRHIKRVLEFNPVTAILFATIIGAFSPFCSCGVIPIIAAMLISGVPLAPVMTFWIASPSMDPEIFFLSVGALGWELAVWRLSSTLIISLSAGFITHYLVKKKWLDETKILRAYNTSSPKSYIHYLKPLFSFPLRKLKLLWQNVKEFLISMKDITFNMKEGGRTICCETIPYIAQFNIQKPETKCTSCNETSSIDKKIDPASQTNSKSFLDRLLKETWKATFLVIKFMSLAFLLIAIIKLYIPQEYITSLLGGKNLTTILTAALIGIPFYTSSLTALPLVGGLLTQGMNPAAALAFLIAGPTTTLPAMAAVWGLTTKRIFILYLSFSMIGALMMGYIYLIVGSF